MQGSLLGFCILFSLRGELSQHHIFSILSYSCIEQINSVSNKDYITFGTDKLKIINIQLKKITVGYDVSDQWPMVADKWSLTNQTSTSNFQWALGRSVRRSSPVRSFDPREHGPRPRPVCLCSRAVKYRTGPQKTARPQSGPVLVLTSLNRFKTGLSAKYTNYFTIINLWMYWHLF